MNLRDINKRFAFTAPIDRWRVRFANGYIADRRLFLAAIAVMIGLFLVVLVMIGTGRHVYVSCPADARGPCRNPFLSEQGFCTVKDAELCNVPTLWPGSSYGEPEPWLARNFGSLCLLIVIITFALNHFLHNRRFKP